MDYVIFVRLLYVTCTQFIKRRCTLKKCGCLANLRDAQRTVFFYEKKGVQRENLSDRRYFFE